MNPFVYPKRKHVRTLNPPTFATYSRYKPYLREEFKRTCVYCRSPDTMAMRGVQSFGADHYRPKKIFPQLAATYTNLFYCCNACNSRKGSYWPDVTRAATHFIPNPCDHKMFDHLRFKLSMVEARTEAGKFTSDLLDLNDPEVVKYREFMFDAIETYECKKKELEAIAVQIRKKLTEGAISLAAADQAFAKIDVELGKVNATLGRFCGNE